MQFLGDVGVLTPHRVSVGVDIFAGLVAASVGIALAGLGWRLAGDPGERFGAAPVAARPRRPIDLGPIIAYAPFGAGQPAAATAVADQALVLRGIMMAMPQSASSALIAVGGAAPTAFYVGQSLGGGTIESIALDHVVMTSGGGRRILAFPDRTGGATAAVQDPAPLGAAVSPAQLPASPDAALASLGMTVAADGLHVAQATVAARALGLQAGDIVTRVNGTPAVDVARNPAAMQAAIAGGAGRIEVTRGDQHVTLGVGPR